MAELKKCPFCGGEVQIYTESVDAETEVYHFECGSCNSDTYFDYADREEAIEAWNNRATESEIRAKAIDEFAERVSTFGTYDYHGNKIDVLEIAEQLKGE